MSLEHKLINKVQGLERFIRTHMRGFFDRVYKQEFVLRKSPRAYRLVSSSQQRFDRSMGFEVTAHKIVLAFECRATTVNRQAYGPVYGIRVTLPAGLEKAAELQVGDFIRFEEGLLKDQELKVVALTDGTHVQLEDVSSYVGPESGVEVRAFASLTKENQDSKFASLKLTSPDSHKAAGLTEQFTATGYLANDSTVPMSNKVYWTVTNGTGTATIDQTGLLTTLTAGSVLVSASVGTFSASKSFLVDAAALVSIAVTPANATIVHTGTQQMTATGHYSDLSTANLTATATWSSSVPGYATIAAGGLATGVAAGTTVISATVGTTSGNTNLTLS